MPATPLGEQTSLFDSGPPGLAFREDFISLDEERALVANLETLSFEPFEFHGWEGKRETVSFGWRYDFGASRAVRAPQMPEFLNGLRDRAAAFASLTPEALEQAMVVRYDVGAGIGWHRDRPVFDRVIGVSLLAPCVMRFRRRRGRRFDRFALGAAPRSAYLLSGEIRQAWEHSISPLEVLRYSITFRNLT
jgi:alkylated DNA repair dioxygenase AlkB